jgi:hypothetical protein
MDRQDWLYATREARDRQSERIGAFAAAIDAAVA